MGNENLEKFISAADEGRLVEAAKLHAEAEEGKEMKGEDLIKKAIQSVAQTSPIPRGVNSDATQNPLTAYTAEESEEIKQKIENLLQIAASAGLVKAAEEARRSSPFILDAFHDALAAKVYPYLKEKGLIK